VPYGTWTSGPFFFFTNYFIIQLPMNIKIIDAHTHVQFEQYDNDRDGVITRALAAGVGMINAGADLQSSRDAVDLAHKYENGIWATVGIHPTESKDFDKFGEIEKLAKDNKVVGIGECGLDYFRDKEFEVQREQKEIFKKHIELSNKTKKPLVIHCREAFADVIDILVARKSELLPEPGILHFFTGTIEDAKKLLELNFSFTFGGLITFNRSFDEIIELIPPDKLLVETDAPFVSPKSHRGKRNEPLYVGEVIPIIAVIKRANEETARKQFLENTKRVFGV
jgi:TatD DNase family protein